MTTVVNLYVDEYDIYIGRKSRYGSGYYGNPYSVENFGRDKCLELYKKHFYCRIHNDLEFKQNILSLKGKRLGCYCKPKSCHGDIIKEYIDTNSE